MKSSYVIIAMLAITCYRAYHLFYPTESCHVKPSIRLNLTVAGTLHEFSWDACHVYSLEYTEARDKFRTAARTMGAEAASIPVVLDDGTDDSPLTIDIAIMRGNLPGVLIHTSGTHGVEGYAGSAIQLALLQEGVLPPREKRSTVVLVHVSDGLSPRVAIGFSKLPASGATVISGCSVAPALFAPAFLSASWPSSAPAMATATIE